MECAFSGKMSAKCAPQADPPLLLLLPTVAPSTPERRFGFNLGGIKVEFLPPYDQSRISMHISTILSKKRRRKVSRP
jgi:hypothetical protein